MLHKRDLDKYIHKHCMKKSKISYKTGFHIPCSVRVLQGMTRELGGEMGVVIFLWIEDKSA